MNDKLKEASVSEKNKTIFSPSLPPFLHLSLARRKTASYLTALIDVQSHHKVMTQFSVTFK